jgi:hypothetical protein
MKSWLLIGGPLILFTGFALHSDLLTFGDQHPGVLHVGGVLPGGTFLGVHKEVYQCDENGANCVLIDESTEFGEVAGLEFEEQAIDYRDGIGGDYNKTKQPGLSKFPDIRLRRGSEVDFDWKAWRFTFEREAALDEVRKEYDEKLKEMKAEE